MRKNKPSSSTLDRPGEVDEGEAGAYRHWLVKIAENVVNAASTGGILGLGGDAVSPSERRFRDRLSEVLTG